jgi:tryptophan 2,3-dioxygenase
MAPAAAHRGIDPSAGGPAPHPDGAPRCVVKPWPMALTDYEKYIRTEQLLALQKAPGELTCHDEMQFQVVHQAAELWMKLIEHELRFACELLAGDQLARAVTTLRRVARVQRILLQQLDLLDTMAPIDYMTIRTGLGRGSGQESPGFRTMLRLPGEVVWPAFAAYLDTTGVSLRDIYDHPHDHHPLFQLCEGLVEYDQLLQIWRYRHLMLVYRIIGTGTPSLKGKHSDLLAHGLKTRFFPALWDVRDDVFGDWTAAQAAKGKDPGYHG